EAINQQEKAHNDLRVKVAELKRSSVGAVVHSGIIVSISEKEIVAKVDGKDLPFPISSGTDITLRGKAAKFADLMPGMAVRITEGQKGSAAVIEAEPPKE